MFACSHDQARLKQYHPKIWTSAQQINTQLLASTTLREQVFHRNKVEARGSIRKASHVISWTIALEKLRNAGGKDAGIIIKAWNGLASKYP